LDGVSSTALLESFSPTVTLDVVPQLIPTFLHFIQVGKPIIDSIIELPLSSKIFVYDRKIVMSLYPTR